MVRYHLWCKNSLLLLKRKFGESGKKNYVFIIEFAIHFYFIYCALIGILH